MNLTLKYPNCQNCGANDYEMNSLNTVKCEYCGTEYEIEMPEEIDVIRDETGRSIYSPLPSYFFSTIGVK